MHHLNSTMCLKACNTFVRMATIFAALSVTIAANQPAGPIVALSRYFFIGLLAFLLGAFELLAALAVAG